MTPAAFLKAAKARGLACVAVTDHNTIAGGRAAEALAAVDPTLPRVIVGAELSTRAGEIIGLYLHEEIPPGLSLPETVSRIRAQGGLVYLPHPCDFLRRGTVAGRERALAAACADVVEVANGRVLAPWFDAWAKRLALRTGKPGGAGSDAHWVGEVGRTYVEVTELPTRETLAGLLRAGVVRQDFSFRDYLGNWFLQALSPATRVVRMLRGWLRR